MPDVAGRRRAVPVALLVAALLVSIVPVGRPRRPPPPGLERFLYALGEVESGGSYTARNATSGAYGKYQIMPASWAAWAKLYLGSSTAPQTPANQETVAHRKVTALYNWLDAWPTVAHWWLTGSSERNASLLVVLLADLRPADHGDHGRDRRDGGRARTRVNDVLDQLERHADR